MAYGLGIDAGGTYTDAVIYNLEEKEIIQTAKAVTIKEDLTIGINESLQQMKSSQLADVSLVSLSTTLATNACVEGNGCQAKLILIGCTRKVITLYGQDHGLPEAGEIIFLEGGHGQDGQVEKEPDWEYLQQEISKTAALDEAYAVVELWGVRNAGFEQKARSLIRQWTNKAVVCGHEITGEINSLKRAASALLNARLLPLINSFLDAVKASLKNHQVDAPLVIVRGDGSLMAESFAREKPVETLLCGPAASVAGGLYLTGQKNCIIVDMGGTTSDLALIRDGQPVLTSAGAQVGQWKTGIHSIMINTVGLGGDSLIRHNREISLDIGPRRAAPLSWAAARWPVLLSKLKVMHHLERRHTVSLAEFFYLLADNSSSKDTEAEAKICAFLRSGPGSIEELAAACGSSVYNLPVQRLEQQGRVMRCGLTPTDIMHLTGEFTAWDSTAAQMAAEIMANQLHISVQELIEIIRGQMKESLFVTLVKMLLTIEYPKITAGSPPDLQLRRLMQIMFHHTESRSNQGFLNLPFSISVPLVGIGAPTHLYLPPVAEALQTECIIPPFAEVANAVGAITGQVAVTLQVIIKPVNSAYGITGYRVFSSTENMSFTEYDQALDWARNKAQNEANEVAKARGAVQFDVEVTSDFCQAPIATSALEDIDDKDAPAQTIHIETIVTARASGVLEQQ